MTTTPHSLNESVSIDLSSDDDDQQNASRSENISVNSTTSKSSVNGHRSQSDVWILYTKTNEPHKLKAAICRHCNTLVNHHKKSELARNHLLKCHNFRKFVNDLDEAEMPDWYPRKKTASSSRKCLLMLIYS